MQYLDKDFHNAECGWKCNHSECQDGIGLTIPEQIEHHNEHAALNSAVNRMNEAHRMLPCGNAYLRQETIRIINDAVDQMYQLRLAPDDTESLTDSDLIDEDISIDEEHFTVEGVEIHTIIDAVKLQQQLEEKLTTWSSGAQDKEAWRHKWRMADDWIPRIPLSTWVTNHLHVWSLLPSAVRDRIIKRPYGPP
jgi:hypothetical protein